jgi:DNA-directed RNA polymerase specialized sigma24 family protein
MTWKTDTMLPAQQGTPAAGRPDGFEAFYLDTSERTFRVACRMAAGDQDLAKDGTQEAYVAMLGHWPVRWVLPTEDNRRYIIGIVSKKVVDGYRTRHRHDEFDDVELPTDEPDPADTLNWHSVLTAVRGLLDTQPT